jgi:hypothetical protein
VKVRSEIRAVTDDAGPAGRDGSPMPSGSRVLACVFALALAGALPELGEAKTLRVGSAWAFAAAVQALDRPGGTIVLQPGRYDALYVTRHGGRPLTIRSARGATIRWLQLEGARAVRLVGLRIRARSVEAQLVISHSRNILVDRVRIRGKTRVPGWLRLLRSDRITVRRSDFTRCGEREACILTGRTSRLRLIRNHFHDCRGCDFVRGPFGRHMLIRENRFDRALRGPCGWNTRNCNHQDLIELQGGRGLIVERNRFGLYQLPGGAQLYVLKDVRNVIIRNNLFLARDPRVPGIRAHVGINLGGRHMVPRNVLITHNTVLSGRSRPAKGLNGSVRFADRYVKVPHNQRPLLVNNVIRLARNPRQLCHWAKLSTANVVLSGSGCSADDVVGDPRLDRHGRPTAASTLTIDRGDGRWSTRVDIDGRLRDAQPDIGAYEYEAKSPRGGR